MNERESMHQQDALDSLIIRKISPDDATLADNVGEYLVIFNIPIETKSGYVRREQITVRFLRKQARDEWYCRYRERFKEVWT